jgi:hypothetical protein
MWSTDELCVICLSVDRPTAFDEFAYQAEDRLNFVRNVISEQTAPFHRLLLMSAN